MSGGAPSVAVVTTVRGRRRHLGHLLGGLARSQRPTDQVVVVRMGGPDLGPTVAAHRGPSLVLDMGEVAADRLPLAAARNRGSEASAADVVVFLDVDCIPGAALVGALAAAVDGGGTVASAQVQYLPAGVPEGPSCSEASLRAAGSFHPVRPPVPVDADLAPELLWTLAIAVHRVDFDAVGGFDEGYLGYGGEDTDFGLRAAAAGLSLRMVAGARAYHQHHPAHDPPLQHAAAITANARRFHQRWGRWPMDGWLTEMAAMGIIDWAPSSTTIDLLRPPTPKELTATQAP